MQKRYLYYVFFAFVFMLNASSSIFVSFLTDALSLNEQYALYLGVSILVFSYLTLFKIVSDEFLVVLFAFYLFLLIWSYAGDPSYGAAKAFLAIVVPLVCVLLLFLRRWTEEDFINSVIFTCLMVLIVAIVYKATFGFFTRSVRFGLFGSITFGWVMSFGAISALLVYRYKRRISHFCLILMFIAALLWSGSKGPLVSCVVVFCLLCVREFPFHKILSGCLFVSIVVFLTKDYLLATRSINMLISVLSNADGYIYDSGYGSIGVRLKFYFSSLELFRNNMLLGVGFGGWGEFVPYTEHYYPHNIFAEMLSETGLLGLLFLLLVLGKMINIQTLYFRSLVLVSTMALLFSGDFSYFRYPLFFILIGLALGRKHFLKNSVFSVSGLRPFRYK